MKYLDYDDTYYVIDIEADSLTPTKIHCLCYENVVTDEKGVLTDYDTIRDFLNNPYVFIGHNALRFDLPVCNRLSHSAVGLSRIIDTLILSQLYSPSLAGGHSLGEWGKRLGSFKIEFDDFSRLTQEMIEYCQQDVALTKLLYKKLAAVLKRLNFSEQSIYIQHSIWHILHKQQQNGFKFDGPRAVEFYGQLRGREAELQEAIYHQFPPELLPIATFKKAFKGNGEQSALYTRHLDQYPKLELNGDGSYTAFDYVEFNLGSPKQRVDKLLELGWNPKEFTPTGNPKPFAKGALSDSLAEFIENHPTPGVDLIAKWMVVNGRANMINTWLENYNHGTGCIHGNLYPADTLRFRHSNPNTANIPAVRVKEIKDERGCVTDKRILMGEEGQYTYESRDLWIARPDRVLVGTDAAGLELRMFAEYLNNPEFTEQVVNGDPHSYNQEMAGLPTRANAKTFIYAYLYGAGDAKIGAITGGNSRTGKELKERFASNFKGLSNVLEVVAAEFRQGRISLIDGAQVVCPSNHAALNYKLQGGGARVMFMAATILDGKIRRKGLDSLKVGDIHDEWQYDVHPSDAKEHAKLAVESIREAGLELNMKVPLDGESKIGKTWAETH